MRTTSGLLSVIATIALAGLLVACVVQPGSLHDSDARMTLGDRDLGPTRPADLGALEADRPPVDEHPEAGLAPPGQAGCIIQCDCIDSLGGEEDRYECKARNKGG